ncbi:MAG: cytochrome d ubiquinol oxidase subunit II [Candidatus Helarchaeota archaeon]|nr:cytochrome d ubiquinol oxidase subunit II [Candidatus Helarchaeota archaeon]
MENLDFFRNIWYVLVGVLLLGYSILDGFDLGIGILFPFLAKDEKDKKVLFNSITPFWDGNEVWLITGGAALFAAFPQAYATVFSGFYLALMLVVFALIFRAVSIEFWHNDVKRRKFWEIAFVIGSFLPSLLYGVALGNVLVGVPLNEYMDFTGNFFTLLRLYPLIIGLLGLAAIMMQGCTYTALKTSGLLQMKSREIAKILWFVFVVLFILSFIVTLIYMPENSRNLLAILAAVIVWIAVIMNRIYLNKEKDNIAFYMSSLAFTGLWGIVGAIHFPNLVRASNDHSLSITIHNASSSELTLKIMLIIVLIGMPIVIAYTAYVYKVFRGKVVHD